VRAPVGGAGVKPATRRKFNVYVVEMDPCASPDHGVGCVYVGETALPPEERWGRHKAGGRTASRVVTRFGRCLRPDLVAGVGPFDSRARAEAAEATLAAKLRRQGYVVFGGQGRTFGLKAETGGLGRELQAPKGRPGQRHQFAETATLPVSRTKARQR
jgi:hypothetical protein